MGNHACYGIRKEGVGKRVGKGLADCGKNVFSFPRAVNALSMLLSMPSSDGVQGYPYIHAFKKEKEKGIWKIISKIPFPKRINSYNGYE